ncbi:MAG: hypothetical protein HFE30_01475 [Clostridiales bacterium]|nr:hypothetical protein [Clostridiales bacterium]
MARKIKTKELKNTRLAANYGGWTYCTECGENIGYLCYATYDNIDFNYECACGSHGHIHIDFIDSSDGHKCDDKLITVKNRLCCSSDSSPLITVMSKKLNSFDLTVTCKECGRIFKEKSDTKDIPEET